MKVALVCHSDQLGGAAIVTYRLMQALIEQGVEAHMLVYSKISDSSNVTLLDSRIQRSLRFVGERLRIFLANGFSRKKLFQVSLANTGYPIHKHSVVKEADVVMLNWINQGTASLSSIKALVASGKKVIWTMHDMWCMTGICHHAYGCQRYKEQCGECPFLGVPKERDLSRTVWHKKKSLYSAPNLHFVAVSNWLAERCGESSLMKECNLSVMPNAFPVDAFYTKPRLPREVLPVDFNRNLILMGAARLDDPVKGLDYAISALNYLFDNHPAVAKDAQAIFFGSLKNRAALDALRFPHLYLGRIHDAKLLTELYARGKVVLSTSLYETLPGTLIEGQASGCWPVTFGNGGQADIVDHLSTGYIAKYKDAQDIANGIMWALKQPDKGDELHAIVKERFAASQIAQRYISLINSLSPS